MLQTIVLKMSARAIEDNAAASSPVTLTRDRILDTAERLFAEHGLQQVSTRDITHAAAANVGAINYYFGGKEGLIEAIFNRRLTPMNHKRIATLEALEKGGAHPRVEDLLDALIRPAVEYCADPDSGSAYFSRLMGRVLGEAGDCIEKLKAAHLHPLVDRFQQSFQKAVPTLSREEVHWRILFTFGAMHYMLLSMTQALPPWMAERPSVELQIQRLVAYAAAGFATPPRIS
jgi:AcrR family transcriptional regulator